MISRRQSETGIAGRGAHIGPEDWIEDFAGQAPVSELPDGVTFIDTAADTDLAVLRPPPHLPLAFRVV